MSTHQRTLEEVSQTLNPVELLRTLDSLDTDQKRNNYLRTVFIETSEVDEFIRSLDQDQTLDLSRKAIVRLKGLLEGFKVYLAEYLKQSGERIERFEARQRENTQLLDEHIAEPEVQESLFKARRRLSKAMAIAARPIVNGKSLKEAALGSAKQKLSPEAQEELISRLTEIITSEPDRTEGLKKLKKHLAVEDSERKMLFEIVRERTKARFEAHMERHPGMKWENVEKKLKSKPDKMFSLCLMELTGGEQDVVDYDREKDEYIFDDCSAESPKGRRNLVYDKAGEEELKRLYPKEQCNGNAVDMAREIGIEMHNEARYRGRQAKEKFDLNTWSWIKTPVDKREAGVALDGFRLGDGVYVVEINAYNHGGNRGFRGSLRV